MSSGMQWLFSNQGSSGSQFLSFEATKEDFPRKTSLDALGFMTISTADALKSDPKSVSHGFQTNLMMAKHVGSQGGTTVHHPVKQFDGRPQEAGISPFFDQSNQTNHIVMSNSVLHSSLASNGQNMVNSTMKTQPIGGVFPQAAPVVSVLPPRTPIVGSTDLRNASKPSAAPSQLTIFYNGSVCVYDLSPEKAHAIMLLAGNGYSSSTPNKVVSSRAPLQQSRSTDCLITNRTRSSSLPSPLSLSCHSGPSAGTVYSPAPLQQSRSSDCFNMNQPRSSSHPSTPLSLSCHSGLPAVMVSSSSTLQQSRSSDCLLVIQPGSSSQISTPLSLSCHAEPPAVTISPSTSMEQSRSGDCFIISQPLSSPLASSLSLSSNSGPPVVTVSSTTNESSNAKQLFSPAASNVNSVELSNSVSSVGSASTRLAPSGLPLARKASLARFLEKRKERAVVTSPYSSIKKSSDNTPGSESVSLPGNGSCLLPAFN